MWFGLDPMQTRPTERNYLSMVKYDLQIYTLVEDSKFGWKKETQVKITT